MKKTMKNLSALLLALSLMLTLLVGCGEQQAPAEEPTDAPAASEEQTPAEAPAEEPAEEKTITLTVTYADETSEEYTIETEAEFLKEAIETTVSLEGEETAYGFTLIAVNGCSADFEGGEKAYWAIYVNGEYGLCALDAQPVADGDSYTLAYESY